MRKKICVYTSSRSDFGLLKPVISELTKYFEVFVLATGAHLAKNRGYTLTEIIDSGIVDQEHLLTVRAFLDDDSYEAEVKAVSIIQLSVAEIFKFYRFDGIVVLGDRYELFGITVPAFLYQLPIFHISGGEITEGAIDDSIRHAVTKLSHVHFVANEVFAENVSRMGEEDWRIQITGESGLDNVHRQDMATIEEVKKIFGIDVTPHEYFLVTYHPVTLEKKLSTKQQMQNLIGALNHFSRKYKIIFTIPGVEKDSDEIWELAKEFAKKNQNVYLVPSFGNRYYLTVLKNAAVVIGNSSSGLVEAPSFKIPTVNIGDRQKNRLCAKSVINCGYEQEEIVKAIEKSLSYEFRESIKDTVNPYDPYGDGKNSKRIAYAIGKALTIDKNLLLRKKFVKEVDRQKWNYLLEGFTE